MKMQGISDSLKILCVVPALREDLHPECESGIRSQTVHIDKLLFVFNHNRGGTLAGRVSFALNRALETVVISEYDYLFRVDSDTVLAPNFLEKILAGAPDLAGNGGYAMLIKVKPFVQFMGGKFNRESDDSYIIYRFQSEGLKVCRINDSFLDTRTHKHRKEDQMFIGTIYYKIGYEPFHILRFLLRTKRERQKVHQVNSMKLLALSYFINLIKREPKFDFASKIWNYQIGRLTHVGTTKNQ
jgi:hypothetical protein